MKNLGKVTKNEETLHRCASAKTNFVWGFRDVDISLEILRENDSSFSPDLSSFSTSSSTIHAVPAHVLIYAIGTKPIRRKHAPQFPFFASRISSSTEIAVYDDVTLRLALVDAVSALSVLRLLAIYCSL